MARTSLKLNDLMVRNICACIERGLTHERAAQACGISKSTLKNWLVRGRKEKRTIYAALLDAIKKAEATGEKFHLANIAEHAKKSWQASAWWLERRYPQRWAKREYQVQEKPGKSPFVVSQEEILKAIDDDARKRKVGMHAVPDEHAS